MFNVLNTDGPTKVRKRAAKACLSCRARKVRCDVSRRGRPCLNCHLDGESCIVTARARTKHSTTMHGSQGSREIPLLPPTNIQTSTSSTKGLHLTSTSAREQENGGTAGLEPDIGILAALCQENSGYIHELVGYKRIAKDTGPMGSELSTSTAKSTEPTFAECISSLFTQATEPKSLTKKSTFALQEDNRSVLNHPQFSSRTQWTANWLSVTTSDVVYGHYSFLSVPNIRVIPHQDLNFLEQEGCLRVPTRPLLDDFIQQYFLHVHPLLPLLNEGDFWEAYDATAYPEKDISLLLLQAMLFASCTFVSQSTVCALGFPNIQPMRAMLLRRTKLLYDLGIEISPLIISQAALLLTFTSISVPKIPNTSWLNLAIENARLADAHLCSTMPPRSEKERKTLKRVWWCCIIRERSIGLLLRRPVQITHDHFNFTADPLSAADLSDEFHRSKVYNSGTKQYLADILTQWVKLYILMTDILLLVCPLKCTYNWEHASNRTNYIQLCECKVALGRWYSSTSSIFPKTSASARDAMGTNDKSININSDTTTFFTNFMYMHYHTSEIVLCHYEVLHGFLQRSGGKKYPRLTNLQIQHTRSELEQAISDIVECHNELIHLELTRWLPISAIGCSIFPLALSVLNAKLSTGNDKTAHGFDATTRHYLIVLVKVMQTYWAQYDDVDWIFEIIRHVVATVQFDVSESTINWSSLIANRPASYLQLTLTLDLCLCKGRLPQDRDFHGNIRDIITNVSRHSEESVEDYCASQTNCANNTTCASYTSQGPPATHPEDPLSLSDMESHPFGLNESFVGNLEEQIHLHIARGFPDNGMSQFMDIGMSSESLTVVGEALSDADISDDSLFGINLADESPAI